MADFRRHHLVANPWVAPAVATLAMLNGKDFKPGDVRPCRRLGQSQSLFRDLFERSGGMMSSGMARSRNLSKCGTVNAAYPCSGV